MYYRYITKIELKGKYDHHTVNKAIRKVLKDSRADSIETKNNIIQFRNSNFSGKWRSNVDYMTLVSKGKFTLIDEDKTIIVFESYASFWGYIIILLFVFIAGYKMLVFLLWGVLILAFGLMMSYLIISKGSIGILRKVNKIIENEFNRE